MKFSNITLALALLFTIAFSACSTQDDPLAGDNINSMQTDLINEPLGSVDDFASYKGGSSSNCGTLTLPMFNTSGSQFQSYGNTVFSHTLTDFSINVIPAGGLKITALQIWQGDFNATLPLLPDGTPDVNQFPIQYVFPTGVASYTEIISKSQLFPCHGFSVHMDVAFFSPLGQPIIQKSAWIFGHRQANGTVLELCIPSCGPITTSF